MSTSRYTLPDLPYDYGALEPHLSAKIMKLHHDKHHRGYVDTANQVLEKLDEARGRGQLESLPLYERQLAFNVSGHVLHSIFWRNLSPDGGGRPDRELAQAIDRDFGSFEKLKAQMNAAASTLMGSGWAALTWDPVLRRLHTAQIHDHQADIMQGSVPLLVLDAWEHAYYLQYQTEKAKYFRAIWNLWNWDDVAARLAAAQRLDLGLSRAQAREQRAGPDGQHLRH